MSRGTLTVGAGWRLWLILAAAALVNLPALAPGFIHDDHPIVEQNELTRDLSRVPTILSRGYWSVGETPVPNLYRPVTILSFALNRALLGDEPLAYRLVNLALHVLTTLLVFGLARRVLPSSGRWALLDPAVVAALLFAVHPVHTEVLGEIVGRSELLAAVGVLGCVLAFLKGRDGEAGAGWGSPWGWYVLSIGCFALGFLAKENAVVAPVLALAADRLIVRRGMRWSYHAAAWGVLALCLGLRIMAIGGINPQGFVHYVDNPIAHLPFLEGRLTALRVITRYALLLVWPARLAIDYSYDAIPLAVSVLEPEVLMGGVLLVVWAAALAWCWRRAVDAAYAVGWMGIAMAPTANLVIPTGTIMAERLLYLPSVGFCLLCGVALARLPFGTAAGRGRPRRAVAGAAVVALLLFGLAARSARRLRDWRDDYTIFARSVEVAPRSARGLFNYGAAAETRGDLAEAARVYHDAIAVWPAFADAHYNLAGVFARQERWEDAIRQYRDALRERPGDVRYLVNFGRSLNALGRSREAVEVLRRAVGIDPASDRAHNNLGAAYLALGETEAAVRSYREAVRLDPSNPEYLMNLGLADQRAGNLGAAIEALTRAVESSPGQPIFRYRLGRALEQDERLTEAAAAYREAIRIAPDSPVPLRSLGILLHRMGDPVGALRALERCAELDSRGTVMEGEARRILSLLRKAGEDRR